MNARYCSNLANNRQQFHQNQSQSSLSKNSNLRSTNNANAQRGMLNANRASAFNTFVPVSLLFLSNISFLL